MTDLTPEQVREDAEKGTRPSRLPGYHVTASGEVWSSIPWRGQTWRPMAQHLNSHGYPKVNIKNGDLRQAMLVHREVCEAFHGPKPTPDHQVRHLNGDRTDNRAANLAWGTASENALDRIAHGNMPNQIGLSKGHEFNRKRGDARRAKMRSRVCLHEGCDVTLEIRNKSGLCKDHKHEAGLCKCRQCLAAWAKVTEGR